MVIKAENRNVWTKDKPLAKDRRSFKGNCFQKIAFGLLFSGILTFSIPENSYALDRFLAGTHGNGIPIGGKTVEEAKAYLEGEYSQNYVLYLKGRDKTEEIAGKDIDYHLQTAGNLEEILRKEEEIGTQDHLDSRIDYSLEGTSASYNTDKLREKIANLSMVKDATETKSASLVKENGVYSVIPEVEGNSLNPERLWARIERALQRGENTIFLSEEGIYDEISSRKAELDAKLEAINRLSSVTIVTNILGNKESLSPEQLQDMVTGVNARGLVFDEAKLLAYAQFLEDKYGNPGNTVSFHSASGKDVAMKTPYALHINVPAEKEALRAAISGMQSMEREPVYAYRPAQYAQPQFGNTFLEIDIALQKVYYYEGGNPVWESPTVTGKLVPDMATPAGVFFLKGKETNRVLRGKIVNGKPSYEAPVSYWMPFNGNIGLHDATWRSKFGGNIYVNSGSHGCINLPKNKAAELFSRIKVGCPVVVH
jgi:hypothetical protein